MPRVETRCNPSTREREEREGEKKKKRTQNNKRLKRTLFVIVGAVSRKTASIQGQLLSE